MQNDIDFFLKEKFNSGMLIVGEWGTGKTYTINEIVRKSLSQNKEYKFISYVSINSINSMEKIEEYIYENKEVIGDGFISTIRRNKKVNIDKMIDKQFEKYGLLAKKNTIDTVIIIDDIERAMTGLYQGDKQNVEDNEKFILELFGMLNRITQNNNSKFIGIANVNITSESINSISKISEKTLSKIVRFKQRGESLDIAIEMLKKTKNKDSPIRGCDYDMYKEMQCDNIRVLYKTLLLHVKIIDIIEYKENDSEIEKIIKNQLNRYYLFLCYLHSYGEFDMELHSEGEISSILNSVIFNLEKNEQGYSKYRKFFLNIYGNDIYPYRYIMTKLLLKLLQLMGFNQPEYMDIKKEINNKIREIKNKISDEGIMALVNKLKTNITNEYLDFSCITNESSISEYDAISLIYFINEPEVIKILINNLSGVISKSESKNMLENIIDRIDKLFPTHKESGNGNASENNHVEKIASIHKIYNLSEECLSKIKQLENEKNEKNKKEVVERIESIYVFILQLILSRDEHREITHFEDGDFNVLITNTKSFYRYSTLKKIVDEILSLDTIQDVEYFSTKHNVFFELIHHADKTPMKFSFFKSESASFEDEITGKINALTDNVLKRVHKIKKQMCEENEYLESAINLYISDRYTQL